MNFDRARNEEQRKIRVEQIKNAAIQLFDTEPFHEITLAKIAEKTSFTRGNLYKYISSKEDIYLLVLLDEFAAWIDDLEKTSSSQAVRNIEQFSSDWAKAMHRHPRLLRLVSLLSTIIEKNVPLESLVDFKKKYALASASLFKILRAVFPAWNDKTIAKFIRMQLQYAIGLYPSTSLSSIQIEANKQSGIPYEQVDFVAEFSEFVFYTLAYLNR